MTNELTIIAAFTLGLLGSGHCAGMCSGIISSLSFSLAESGSQTGYWLKMLGYHLGRLLTYATLGVAAGAIGQIVTFQSEWPVLLLISAMLLIFMGLYLGGWWFGLTHLEKAGQILWRRIRPLSEKLLPVDSMGKAVLLGLFWGFLPCGLIYSTLAYATTAETPIHSGLLMLAFGLGTLPTTLAIGGGAMTIKKWSKNQRLRKTFALGFILFGLYTFYSAFSAAAHHHTNTENQPEQEQHNHH